MPTPTLARKAYRQETFSAPAFAIALEDLNLNGVDSANEGSSNLILKSPFANQEGLLVLISLL